MLLVKWYEDYRGFVLPFDEYGEWRIIGNIHENPELVKD
jgi:hypothetical protein